MLTMLAHAGHGQTDGFSLLHWLVEPAHLPLTLAAAALCLGLAVFARRRKA